MKSIGCDCFLEVSVLTRLECSKGAHDCVPCQILAKQEAQMGLGLITPYWFQAILMCNVDYDNISNRGGCKDATVYFEVSSKSKFVHEFNGG